MSLIFQISHLHPHIVQFHLLYVHLSYYPLLLQCILSHKTQNLLLSQIISALVCFCTHRTDLTDFWIYIFYILVSLFVNSLFRSHAVAQAGYLSVLERTLNINVLVLCIH